MCVDEMAKCADVQCENLRIWEFAHSYIFTSAHWFLIYFFMVIIISLIMKRLYIHMLPLYIHGMAKRKQKKFLHLTLVII
jgi:hypothetical protein